jgi:hypothetical protein
MKIPTRVHALILSAKQQAHVAHESAKGLPVASMEFVQITEALELTLMALQREADEKPEVDFHWPIVNNRGQANG